MDNDILSLREFSLGDADKYERIFWGKYAVLMTESCAGIFDRLDP